MASRPLKSGFTTGAAAAAASKAALMSMIAMQEMSSATNAQLSENTDGFSGFPESTECQKSFGRRKHMKTVMVRCLNGSIISIPVKYVRVLSCNCAEAVVTKDAGDDPDITHKADIGARVRLYTLNGDTAGWVHTGNSGHVVNTDYMLEPIPFGDEAFFIEAAGPVMIRISGGEGVGIVTKPGLEVEPGKAAINSGPRKMILEAISAVIAESKTIFTEVKTIVHVEIFVPKGKELAKKTLNARLGILGGISILGTTGIVKPMSHDAYIATIRAGISVAVANGVNILVLTTGRRSEMAAMNLFPALREEAFVQIGDFFKASIEAALSASIQNIHIVAFFGKAVKMAMGFPHTHAARSELTMKTLAQWADELCSEMAFPDNIISGKELAQNIAGSNTARHAFGYIYPDFPELVCHIGRKIIESAGRFANNRLKIRAIILDFEGNRIFDSDFRDV